MKRYLTILVLLLTGSACFSQTVKQREASAYENAPLQEAYETPAPGSYIVLSTNNNLDVNLSDQDMQRIAAARKVDEVVYVTINPNVQVKVLPYSALKPNQQSINLNTPSNEK
ncbi:MAG: hypothetical protein KDD41_06605 [Flavobacteriales bacterium]|nr:hypothetical protein [Flavobacteriales bacterium]